MLGSDSVIRQLGRNESQTSKEVTDGFFCAVYVMSRFYVEDPPCTPLGIALMECSNTTVVCLFPEQLRRRPGRKEAGAGFGGPTHRGHASLGTEGELMPPCPEDENGQGLSSDSHHGLV